MLNKRQKGIALVVVLWTVALLTIMAAGYSATMRTETRLTANQLQVAQSRALAEAGIWLGVKDLLRPLPDQQIPKDGAAHEVVLEQGTVILHIHDEAGRIDLNSARSEILMTLLQYAGMDQDAATGVLNAILDWRDQDDQVREQGAEEFQYKRAGLDYGPKNGPFNSIEELRLVLGMTEPVFTRLRPLLTLHSNQPGINPAVASRETLTALSGEDSTGVDEFMANRIGNEQTGGVEMLTGIDSRFFSSSRDKNYLIVSEGTVGGSKMRLQAVIMKKNLQQPYTVLSWQETKVYGNSEQDREDDNEQD